MTRVIAWKTVGTISKSPRDCQLHLFGPLGYAVARFRASTPLRKLDIRKTSRVVRFSKAVTLTIWRKGVAFR